MKKLLSCSGVLWATMNFAAMQSSVSQYGITWTFDKQYECGQFANTDWWVVGPVTVTSVSPAPTADRQGSVVNPKADEQGYDSRISGYNAASRASFPLALNVNQSLVSSVENPAPEAGAYFNPILTAAVLTCVPQARSADSFRPSYCGSSYKPYFSRSQLKLNLLPRVQGPAATTPGVATYERVFQRIWLDHLNPVSARQLHPKDNMSNYGREVVHDISIGTLLMMTSAVTDKLINNVVQLGIDYYGAWKAGQRWKGEGGFGNGMLWMILLAGVLLDDTEMLNVNANPQPNQFGENDKTYYGAPTAKYPSGAAMYGIVCTYNNGNFCSPDYGAKDCRDPNGVYNACAYIDCCNSAQWVGEALAARMMHVEQYWKWPAYFDYVDRYQNGEITVGTSGNVITGAASQFVQDMWTTYRANIPDPSGKVSFTCSPRTGEPPLAVTFTNTSSDDFTAWQWDFGDGNSSTAKNPVHTYQNLGTYTVTLTGTGTGGTDTYTITDAIKVTNEVIIEAESITNLNGYLVDNVNGGGQMIQVDAAQTPPYTGTAAVVFPGATGTYTITLFAVPENDGTPTVRLYVNGVNVIDQVLPQHADYFNLATRLEYTANNITVNQGDEIKIEGVSDSGAYARVDKIIFSATTMSIDIRQLTIDKKHQAINLVPNPMRGMVWFETANQKIDRLTIFDNAGNMVMSHVGANGCLPLQWDGTDIAGQAVKPGVYYFEVEIGGYVESGKIIKLK